MTVETPWMLTTGSTMLGFLLPEFFAVLGRAQAPITMNVYCAIACGLIAGAFVA